METKTKKGKDYFPKDLRLRDVLSIGDNGNRST